MSELMPTQFPTLVTRTLAFHCDLLWELFSSKVLIVVASLCAVGAPWLLFPCVDDWLLPVGVVVPELDEPALLLLLPLLWVLGSTTKTTTDATAAATATVATTAPTRAPRDFFGCGGCGQPGPLGGAQPGIGGPTGPVW